MAGQVAAATGAPSRRRRSSRVFASTTPELLPMAGKLSIASFFGSARLQLVVERLPSQPGRRAWVAVSLSVFSRATRCSACRRATARCCFSRYCASAVSASRDFRFLLRELVVEPRQVLVDVLEPQVEVLLRVLLGQRRRRRAPRTADWTESRDRHQPRLGARERPGRRRGTALISPLSRALSSGAGASAAGAGLARSALRADRRGRLARLAHQRNRIAAAAAPCR